MTREEFDAAMDSLSETDVRFGFFYLVGAIDALMASDDPARRAVGESLAVNLAEHIGVTKAGL